VTHVAARLLDAVERALAAVARRAGGERPAVIGVVFHGLFADEREGTCGVVDPFQPLCVGDLRRFIDDFLGHGYQFVSPRQVATGLDARRHHVLLTFDDGYANNLRALPILREFQVPATFFISSNHVAEGRAFWWDVLHRERHRRGVAAGRIRREQVMLKHRPYWDIDAYLRAEFGANALRPVGDTDRPMSPEEVQQCAAEALVTIGNHTADHAILTVLDDEQVGTQVRSCQAYLGGLTGTAPEIIAYPNGDYDDRVVERVRAEGLRLGVVVEQRKNRLPLAPDAALRMARFFIPAGARIIDQSARCRSDLQIRSWLGRAFTRRPAAGARRSSSDIARASG
jgi:peptidoglycan/xylan/chitin deacetylase (PgdA/CDA1 family)